MSTNSEVLLKRINTLEVALLILINSLRDHKDGYTVEIPDKTLDNIEKILLTKK
jgi:hypothetical protein